MTPDEQRAYQREYQRKWRERNLEKCKHRCRQWKAANPDKAKANQQEFNHRYTGAWVLLKERIGCAVCGYNKNGAALHWHHRKGETKSARPSDLMRRGDVEKLLDEIEKCDLLCANCHAEIHHR